MTPFRIVVHPDPITAAVLDTVALSYGLATEELVAQMLYRDCAAMSGWPGQLGAEIRRQVRNVQFPHEPDGEETPF